MSDTPDQDDHILEQVDLLHAAHRRGDGETATAIRDLVDSYGLAAITSAMAARDVHARLGVELELLRLVGPAALYGRAGGPAARP
ncbi:hypothetical protein [Nocardia sp. XZ_19_231]|uniref:hypothetical protein n=1 Tax=Nocardia sp. XZ_19_231 TaxID=2769252 RepID=UPI00188E6B80|nr:hypothetical protein [Nocardia sp. XZ_19_231]